MHEVDAATFTLSFIVTWGIGLLPPVLIRFVFRKRPLDTWPAVGICALFWLLNIAFFTALGSQSKTHGALALVALVSYWILRKSPTPKEREKLQVEINARSKDGTTLLMGAALTGQIKRMRKLVDSGANVNAVDERGWTSLMYAAIQGELDVVTFLLEQGADPVLRNNDGHTAIDIAEQKEFLEIASALQKAQSAGRTANIELQRTSALETPPSP